MNGTDWVHSIAGFVAGLLLWHLWRCLDRKVRGKITTAGSATKFGRMTRAQADAIRAEEGLPKLTDAQWGGEEAW